MYTFLIIVCYILKNKVVKYFKNKNHKKVSHNCSYEFIKNEDIV